MYLPEYAKPGEAEALLSILKNNLFVTLISNDLEQRPFVSHIPVRTVFDSQSLVGIHGHFAKRNPHVQYLEKNNEVTLIFHGPHAYISPKWYKSGRDVPTWNYCVVHVHGKLKLLPGFEDICASLKDLTSTFETGESAWRFELPDDLLMPEQLTSAITAFEIIPDRIEAKFKLSQNRPKIDRDSVASKLAERNDEMSTAIAQLMQKSLAR